MVLLEQCLRYSCFMVFHPICISVCIHDDASIERDTARCSEFSATRCNLSTLCFAAAAWILSIQNVLYLLVFVYSLASLGHGQVRAHQVLSEVCKLKTKPNCLYFYVEGILILCDRVPNILSLLTDLQYECAE